MGVVDEMKSLRQFTLIIIFFKRQFGKETWRCICLRVFSHTDQSFLRQG